MVAKSPAKSPTKTPRKDSSDDVKTPLKKRGVGRPRIPAHLQKRKPPSGRPRGRPKGSRTAPKVQATHMKDRAAAASAIAQARKGTKSK